MTGGVSNFSQPTIFHSPRSGRVLQSFGCLLAGAGFLVGMIVAVLVLVVVFAWPGNWAKAAVWTLIGCGGMVTLLGAWAVARRWQRRFWWTIALDDAQVRFQRGAAGAAVPYADVLLVEAVAALMSIVQQLYGPSIRRRLPNPKRLAKTTLPMVVHTTGPKRYQIVLSLPDIASCFPALMSRCPRAGGIGLDGVEVLPQLPEAAAAALRTMGKLRRRAGRLGLWFCAGPLLVGVVGPLALLAGGVPAMQRLEAWLALIGVPPAIYAIVSCRRLVQRGTMLLRAADHVEQAGLPTSDGQNGEQV